MRMYAAQNTEIRVHQRWIHAVAISLSYTYGTAEDMIWNIYQQESDFGNLRK